MSERLRIEQVIVVEGRYDASALAPLVDALILTTDGFAIYKDKQTQALLKELGRKRGIILLTDSDAAGFRIRTFLTNLIGESYVKQAYVPAIHGKEARKSQPGKEGLLGVEGISADLLRKALLDAGASQQTPRQGRSIAYVDLYQWGLSGTAGSQEKRFALLKKLGLPNRLSKKALLDVLNQLYTYEEIEALAKDS